MPHWTSANEEAFINRITFDFIAQLQNRLETTETTQSEFARKMRVSEGAVSQVLNLNRTNLHLRTMVRYARSLGMKVAVVAYDDRDPQNENGPVGSEIFSLAWQKLGQPRDVWSVNENIQAVAANHAARFLYAVPYWKPGCVSTTLSAMRSTAVAEGFESYTVPTVPTITMEGGAAYA